MKKSPTNQKRNKRPFWLEDKGDWELVWDLHLEWEPASGKWWLAASWWVVDVKSILIKHMESVY